MVADDDASLRRIQAKLQPQRIRSTLAFAGLYQMTHELIKVSVLHDVRQFYGTGFDSQGWRYDEESYKTRVLALAPKDRFRASLLWLVDGGAITVEKADRLKAIYDHRHQLTHGLIGYIIDPKLEPDVDLFEDAVAILSDIKRFWTSVEMDIGTFEDHGDVDLDNVVPLSLMILQTCIAAYAAGLDEDAAGDPGSG